MRQPFAFREHVNPFLEAFVCPGKQTDLVDAIPQLAEKLRINITYFNTSILAFI